MVFNSLLSGVALWATARLTGCDFAQECLEKYNLVIQGTNIFVCSIKRSLSLRSPVVVEQLDETAVPLHLINSNLDEVNLAKRALWTILSSSDAMPCLYRGGGTSGGVLLQASHLRSLLR